MHDVDQQTSVSNAQDAEYWMSAGMLGLPVVSGQLPVAVGLPWGVWAEIRPQVDLSVSWAPAARPLARGRGQAELLGNKNPGRL